MCSINSCSIIFLSTIENKYFIMKGMTTNAMYIAQDLHSFIIHLQLLAHILLNKLADNICYLLEKQIQQLLSY